MGSATVCSNRVMTASAVAIVGCAVALLPASTATASGHVGKTWAESTMRSGAAHPSTDLGYPVAIFGNTMVVGAAATVVGHRGGGQGALYVYTKPRSGVWADATPTAVLTVAGSPPTDDGDGLGTGVAIEGNTIVAGNSAAGKDASGALYIFTKPRHGWHTTSHPSAVLTGSPASNITYLGGSVAMHGDTIVASGYANNYPAAVVFTRPASGWVHEHETADLVNTSNSGSSFMPVAVSANTVVVGAGYGGAAWLFTEPSTGWANTTTPTQAFTESNNDKSTPDGFGYAVAVEGRTVAIGAVGDLFYGEPPIKGGVYFYQEPAGGWGSVASPMSDNWELQSVHEPKGDEFGASVAFSGPTLAVGAPAHVIGHHLSAGAGYVFDTADHWLDAEQIAALPDPNGGPYDEVGWSTAISGSSVVFGAEFAYKSQGAADVYTELSKPTLTKLSQTHSSWQLGSRAPSVNPKHAPKGGDRFTYRLNEPAKVTLTFASPGAAKLRLTVAGKAGLNKVYVDGPITKHLGLQPGRYTLKLQAKNAATAKSVSKTLHFVALAQ
jgi:hypothetical protein